MNRIVLIVCLGVSTLALASEKTTSLDIVQRKDTVLQNSDCYDVEIYVTTANDRTTVVSYVKNLKTNIESYQGSIITSQIATCGPISCPELMFLILKEHYEKAQESTKEAQKKPTFALIKTRRNRKK